MRVMEFLRTAKRKKKVDVETRIALLRALTRLSETDPLYADVYLERAEQFLLALCPRHEYGQLRGEREDLPRAVDELRRATDRGDWRRVYELAADAAAKKERVTVAKAILEIADAVYGPRTVHATSASLGLQGIVPLPTATIEHERGQAIEWLRLSTSHDADYEPLYQQRTDYFTRLEVIPHPDTGMVVGTDGLRLRVLSALDRGDFQEVQRLTEETTGSGARLARTRVPRATNGRADALAEPFSTSVLDYAKDLGLVATTLPSEPALNAYLSCCCAERTTFPSGPRTEANRATEGCTCGHPCPPAAGPVLREGLDLLLVHPFISSSGARYLPWFGPEAVLVETFPETTGDPPTRLLGALGLSGRRGLPRLAIEDALRSRSGAVCRALGLDPLEFVVACIPFDAYLRLAPQHDWGRQQLWTHFDGYQVTRDLRLHALVGGDVQFGGAADVCAVQRDYDPDRLVARFCILRRARFVVRQHADASGPGGER